MKSGVRMEAETKTLLSIWWCASILHVEKSVSQRNVDFQMDAYAF